MATIASKAFSDVIFDISPPIEFDPHSTQPPRVDRGRARRVVIRGTSMTTKKVIVGADGKRKIGIRDNGEAAPDVVMLSEVADADWEAVKQIHASNPLISSGAIRRVGNKADAKSVGRELEGLRTHDRRLPLDRDAGAKEAALRAEENLSHSTEDDDAISILEKMAG